MLAQTSPRLVSQFVVCGTACASAHFLTVRTLAEGRPDVAPHSTHPVGCWSAVYVALSGRLNTNRDSGLKIAAKRPRLGATLAAVRDRSAASYRSGLILTRNAGSRWLEETLMESSRGVVRRPPITCV
jgi:hypothetical protein